MTQVWKIISIPKNIKHRLILTTTYAAGLRVGELRRLKPEYLDRQWMLIKVVDGKGRNDRYTMLSKKLLAELRHYYTIAAIEAGIGAVSVTVNGIGEWAGNASLEQVVMAAKTIGHRICSIDTRKLVKICRFVARITNRPIAVGSPITGKAAFSYESGIHCAALLKDPNTYQPFLPEILGRESGKLLVGRYSGSTVLKHIMEKAGVVMDAEKTERLLAVVRAESLKNKGSMSPGELLQLYQQCVH